MLLNVIKIIQKHYEIDFSLNTLKTIFQTNEEYGKNKKGDVVS